MNRFEPQGLDEQHEEVRQLINEELNVVPTELEKAKQKNTKPHKYSNALRVGAIGMIGTFIVGVNAQEIPHGTQYSDVPVQSKVNTKTNVPKINISFENSNITTSEQTKATETTTQAGSVSSSMPAATKDNSVPASKDNDATSKSNTVTNSATAKSGTTSKSNGSGNNDSRPATPDDMKTILGKVGSDGRVDAKVIDGGEINVVDAGTDEAKDFVNDLFGN